ncbi:hypothetical protein E5Q_00632 [Mixia osmundae IAM 14324]|uniref:STI1 domain-containing protein n=1 Tax=Mixia osmundae (strain CBS 9802 / IAM 14324 / JCM 22182 / KY 12970) TaxID=764103 RepID=G7DTS5_MIXOS|nr:hypothetical protein E5Q_00632 [Mixia osmundae IAM 14324]
MSGLHVPKFDGFVARLAAGLTSMADDGKAGADAEKKLGNTAYQSRQFEAAIEHYQRAWELHKDITYLNNLSAVYFEQGNYDLCIATCLDAAEQGRDLRADYKTIAKSFTRLGTAYTKKEDWDQAIRYFQKSLTEHRTPDALAKLKEAERTKLDKERQAYVDPALSDKARDEGNTLFKAGDWPGAVKLYEEAIKRNPNDARGYTNRAAALAKLMAFPEALKDAEAAIKVDPAFVKGYIRKALILFGMKEYSKALTALSLAKAADKDGKSEKEIRGHEQKIVQAQYASEANETDEEKLARAQRDPEIQRILSDPALQQILQQAQSDPQSLASHMQNADIRDKILKLVNAGIIKMGPR